MDFHRAVSKFHLTLSWLAAIPGRGSQQYPIFIHCEQWHWSLTCCWCSNNSFALKWCQLANRKRYYNTYWRYIYS